MMIIFIIIIGYILYLIFNENNGLIIKNNSKDDSLEILKKRYINEEISEEEYKRILKTIKD